MWTVSARLAAERRKRRDEFRPARSRCGRSQVRVVMRRRRQWRERARECSTPPEDSRDAGQAWSLHSLVRRWRAMSAIGTKQTSILTLNMSAFRGKADIPNSLANVR
jgi:hypothetical protein